MIAVNRELRRHAYILLVVAIPLLWAGRSVAQQQTRPSGSGSWMPYKSSTMTIHHDGTALIFGDSVRVSYRSNSFEESVLEFSGIDGVGESCLGPFTASNRRFTKGGVFFVRVRSGEMLRIQVVQEVQKEVTLQIQLADAQVATGSGS